MRTSSLTSIIVFIAVSAVLCQAAADDSLNLSEDQRGDGIVTIYRPVKNSRQTFKYRNKNGEYDRKVFEEIAHFFRCRLTSESHAIDPALIEMLDAVEDHFQADELGLISAYRSPTRNAIMRRSGRRVAKGSLHMQGKAADIVIAGVAPAKIRDFAYQLGGGGVGYYGRRSFVHIDSGRVRTWGWNPRATSKGLSASSKRSGVSR